MGAPVMPGSLSGEGELVLRLSLVDAAAPENQPRRHSCEEKTLALFDQLREPLLRYVVSLRISPERGEEIIQETFLRLFEHLKAHKPDANLRGWLFRVAHNFALRDLRGRGAQMLSSHATPDFFAEASEDPSPDPEQRLILSQREAGLLEALKKLPLADQQCLHLRAEGLRYREIATVLNLGVSTVADNLHRAIDALRKELRG